MTKIEQLESKLNQKTDELNVSLKAQDLLLERLKNNTQILGEFESLFKAIQVSLKFANDTIYTLQQENNSLKLSSDEWTKRAIQLEFKVLNAGDGTKNRK
jgi:hypothetical protein